MSLIFQKDSKDELQKLIAPCGMNCGICLAYLRNTNHCDGCWGNDTNKSKHCAQCAIKNCKQLAKTESGFCYDCIEYPCARLRQLDKRYRNNYNMSMIENLENIKNQGIEKFMETEESRWLCKECGGTICVHRNACLSCN